MTDEQLAAFLNIPVELVARITPEKRVVYERLFSVESELHLWQQGVAPKPEGVIVLRERKRR